MTTEADKVTAKLMSLADNWALSAGDSAVCGDESLPMQCETRAALEQAIRRAVDWGEPVAYTPADVLAELKTTNSGLMLDAADQGRHAEANGRVNPKARTQ